MSITVMDRLARQLVVALLLLLAAALVHASPGTAAFEAGDMDAARTLLEGEIAADADPAKRLLLGRIELQERRYDEALGHFEAVAAEWPEDADAHYWLGAAYGNLAANASLLRAGGYARKTRRAFERSLALEPAHVEATIGLARYYLQAPRLMGGDKREAEALAERLTETSPIEGGLLLVEIYRATDRESAAGETLRRLTKDHPDEARGWLQLGFARQSSGDFAEAHSAFLAASRVAADDERRLAALYQVGRTAVFSEQNVAAGIEALQAYLEAYPEANAGADLPGGDWARFRLAQLHALAGDEAAVTRALDTALAETSDDELVREIRRFGKRR